MRLTEQDRKILVALQFEANTPVVELAQRLRVGPHVIHYTLKKYRENGVLRRGALIDFSLLGLELYTVYFALSAKGIRKKSSMMKKLINHAQVAWVGELGGNFHYGVAFYARGSSEAKLFLQELSRLTAEGASKKELSLIHKLHLFPKRYLWSGKQKGRGAISREAAAAREEIDKKDQGVLYSLFQPGIESHQDMARLLGLARSTLEYRLNRLEETGIIARYVYFISAFQLGFLVYRLLIRIRGLRSDTSDKLFQFANETPSVVALSECLGPSEYELGIEVENSREVVEVLERLQLQHGEIIEDIEVLPVFSQTTSRQVFSPTWPLQTEALRQLA